MVNSGLFFTVYQSQRTSTTGLLKEQPAVAKCYTVQECDARKDQ